MESAPHAWSSVHGVRHISGFLTQDVQKIRESHKCCNRTLKEQVILIHLCKICFYLRLRRDLTGISLNEEAAAAPPKTAPTIAHTLSLSERFRVSAASADPPAKPAPNKSSQTTYNTSAGVLYCLRISHPTERRSIWRPLQPAPKEASPCT